MVPQWPGRPGSGPEPPVFFWAGQFFLRYFNVHLWPHVADCSELAKSHYQIEDFVEMPKNLETHKNINLEPVKYVFYTQETCFPDH